MPNCAKCKTPLLLPVDEYGERDAPLCRTCYLTQDNRINDPEMELKAILDEIREYSQAINAENITIWRLRGRLDAEYSEDTLSDLKDEEDERDILMQKLGELRKRHYNLIKAVKDERLKEQARLVRWTEGVNAK